MRPDGCWARQKPREENSQNFPEKKNVCQDDMAASWKRGGHLSILQWDFFCATFGRRGRRRMRVKSPFISLMDNERFLEGMKKVGLNGGTDRIVRGEEGGLLA